LNVFQTYNANLAGEMTKEKPLTFPVDKHFKI